MDAFDENRQEKRPRIRDLIAENIILDGYGGARCNVSEKPCPYHQELFILGNFHRHILNKHPIEAAAKGFAACRRQRDDARQIPESYVSITRSDDAGVHCVITDGLCRYIQPIFNLKRFKRHICLIHPWEAKQRNIKFDVSSGKYPKLHVMVLKHITYNANGIHCRIDPDSKCPYRLQAINTTSFRLHFMDHHPEHAERYGFFEDAGNRPNTARGIRTKRLSRLVEEYVYVDEEGCHCQLDPDCDYTIENFCSIKLLSHFRHKHPAHAKSIGFFEKRRSKLESDFHVRIWECTKKGDDGNYHCRIDGECSFLQRKFYSQKFLQHFRSQHRRVAKEKHLFDKPPELVKRSRGERNKGTRAKIDNKYGLKVSQHTETDEYGIHCRIAGSNCEYVQSTFRPNNFRRHFRNIHPKEAKENGFFEGNYVAVKSEFSQSVAGKQPKRPFDKPTYSQIVEDCIMRGNRAVYCRISADYCKFRQLKFDLGCLVRHFRKAHPEEAKAKGFAKGGHAKKKIKKEAPVDPLDIKQEVEADEEDQLASEASNDEEWGLLTPDEVAPSAGSLTPIRQLVEKNILRVKTDVFCQISTEYCDYNRSEAFDPKDFVRHFRFKHPDEAREKGFFGDKVDVTEDTPLIKKSFRSLVAQNVFVDKEGIHCMISETACSTFQIAYNAGNFVRHFRNEHPQEAEEKGFIRRKIYRKKRKRNQSGEEDLDASEMEPAASKMRRGSLRSLVEKFVVRNGTESHCKISAHFCKYVQTTEFRYQNFLRHFLSAHPIEACDAGFEVDKKSKKYNRRIRNAGKPTFSQLVRQYSERDETGIHCRISSTKCRYRQKYNYCPGNFVRHFRTDHPEEAREVGFFRHEDTDDDYETDSEAEPKSVTENVKIEPFSIEEQESIYPDTPHDESLQKKTPTLKQLVQEYIFRDISGTYCRISQKPCRYVQRGIFNYHNIVSHFRTEHSEEARAAGFFRNLNATSDVANAQDALTESFSQGEGQPESPCPDTSQDETQKETNAEGLILNQKQQTEKYVFRDDLGVHCRISKWPCKYVQTGQYSYQNFIRHFRSIHPREAKTAGFVTGVNDQETEHISGELEEAQQVDHDISEDERWKMKNGKPSLRRLTKKFVLQDSKGVHCRISSLPCRYIQRGSYKYTNFVRHFRTEHTEEASEAGFFRGPNYASESEHDSADPGEASGSDTPLELDLGGKTGLIELVAKYVYRNKKGIHCRISSSPCIYVQRYGFKYRNFISHFHVQHTEEARKAGFFKDFDEASEPEHESVGAISCDSITHDETMESFSTEQSLQENSEASRALKLLIRKPSLKQLAEKFIVRDEKGAHCRISPWPCKYIQRSTYVVGNFVRHFRTEHPKDARKAGFFRGRCSQLPEPESVPIEHVPYEDASMESMPIEESEPRPGTSQETSKRRKNGTITFTKLAEKCMFRDEEGVHCRIVPWPPCKYVQRSNFSVGNLIRHFRKDHPAEARKVGFFREYIEPELEPYSMELEHPLVSIPQDPTSEPMVLEENQPEEPCLDTPHDDPAMYCRLCFSADLPLAPIFSGPDAADNPLVESIEECISVRLTADDDAYICSECCEKLVAFQQFRQLSQLHDSTVRQKKQRLVQSGNSAAPLVVQSGTEVDTFYVEVVKQEEGIETPTESPVTEAPSAAATECDDQKPFIELPSGSFSCRLCPLTFPSLGPTMEHFMSAHGEAMHTNSVLSVDYSDKPPFKAVTVKNVQYLKCADCDTLTEHGEAIIEHRKQFHTGPKKILPTIKCDRAECGHLFMDNPAYQRHLEICHDGIDLGQGRS